MVQGTGYRAARGGNGFSFERTIRLLTPAVAREEGVAREDELLIRGRCNGAYRSTLGELLSADRHALHAMVRLGLPWVSSSLQICIQSTRYGVHGAGYTVQGTWHRVHGTWCGYRVHGTGCMVHSVGTGCMVQGTGRTAGLHTHADRAGRVTGRVQHLELATLPEGQHTCEGAGCRVQGVGCRVQVRGKRVEGRGWRVG